MRAIRRSTGLKGSQLRISNERFDKKNIDTNVHEVLEDFESFLEKKDLPELSEGFKKSRGYINTKPDESITESSSYVETVCKYILNTLNAELPKKQEMTSHINACLKCLNLSPDPTARKDVKQIVSGLRSIAQGIGSLRTHHGSAHGKIPGEYKINSSYAKLACNASVVLTYFLLEKLEEKKT